MPRFKVIYGMRITVRNSTYPFGDVHFGTQIQD